MESTTPHRKCHPHGKCHPPWKVPPPPPLWCMAMVAAKYIGLWGQISSWVFACCFFLFFIPCAPALNKTFAFKAARLKGQRRGLNQWSLLVVVAFWTWQRSLDANKHPSFPSPGPSAKSLNWSTAALMFWPSRTATWMASTPWVLVAFLHAGSDCVCA